MNTDEILKKLTVAQRQELDADIAEITKKVTAAYKRAPETFADVSTNIRLSDEIFLNVRLSMHLGDKNILYPVIENIEQFATIDEYLDAINKDRNPPHGAIKLK